ncbi:MAG: hypothetical protein GC204_13105 [Chloroflexi bacterium]|nr:hypothetical protein [Chloroflexota bacterium]
MTQPNLDELSQVAQAALLQHLQTQTEIEAILDGEAVLLNLDGSPTILARVLEVTPTEAGAVAQVGVRLSSEWINEEGIIDVVAGIERAPYLAARSAVDKWLRYTFPPIRAAFASDDEMVRGVGITQLVAHNDEQWQILSANPLMIGMPQDQIDLDNATREKRLFPGFVGDPLAERLGDEERALHWLKIYVASSHGRVIAECQFDNRDWDELAALLMAEFSFPPLSASFLSLTQFLVIRPA